jgi:amino acid transporter
LADPSEKAASSRNRFGTFGGVFTPSILTILGVVMFMRANFVVGQAGILGAVIILIIAKSISLLTTFSVSAISTNTRVKGGGSYYLISRSLGPEFGGSIGIAYFCALALSVPFYVLGFTEAPAMFDRINAGDEGGILGVVIKWRD